MTRASLSRYRHGAAVFCVSAVMIVITTVLGSSVYVTDTDVTRDVATRTDVCSTETCKATAKKILSYINTTADPCEDFYDYACGKWPLLHKLSDNKTLTGEFHDLDEKMQLIVQDLLGRNNSGAFASETTAKTMYKQCLNQAKPLISLLDDLIGGWPVITPSWNPNKFDLLTSLINLRLYGEESLFSFDVDQELEIPNRNVLFLSGPEGFTTREVLESDVGKKYADSHMTFLINATSLLLRDNGDTTLVSAVLPDLAEIMDLNHHVTNGQTAIGKANLTLMKNKTKLGTVQENILFRSNLAQSLTTYMKAVFQAVDLSKQINSNTETVISYPTFFHLLDKKLLELQNLNNEGKRQLANFIDWRVITNNIRYFSKDYRDAYEEHVGRVQGQKVKREPTAAERCAKDLIAMMPLTVGAIYVRDNVSIDLKPKASMMMKDLKQGFETLLVAATWMDSTTFAKATQKLAAMIDFVGYPDAMVTNSSAIDEEYKEIIVRHTYFDTVRDASKNKNFRSLRLLTKQNKRDDPFRGKKMDITQVNPFNSLQNNKIVILAAALQLPFYDPNDPQYVNYGGIGFIIGHEITHGFDNQGAIFDDQGGLHSWWTENTTRIYDMKKRGISEQYGNYSFPFGKVDGELTLGENIADNGGIKAAYAAYNIYRSRLTQPEAPVIGLETFTDDQLCFLSVGQVWCAEVRPETQRLNLLTNPHSPARFRVNGPLSNMPEFSSAFHCPSGSKMNPVVKQAVW